MLKRLNTAHVTFCHSVSYSFTLISTLQLFPRVGKMSLIKVEEHAQIMEEFSILFPMNPMNDGERGKEVVALTTCAADSFSS